MNKKSIIKKAIKKHGKGGPGMFNKPLQIGGVAQSTPTWSGSQYNRLNTPMKDSAPLKTDGTSLPKPVLPSTQDIALREGNQLRAQKYGDQMKSAYEKKYGKIPQK